VLELVVRRSSALDRWTAGHVPETVEVVGRTVSTSWLPMTLDMAGTLLVVSIAWAVAGEFLDAYVVPGHPSPPSLIASIFTSTWAYLLALVAACSVALTLLHMGIAETDPGVATSQEVGSTMGWLSWHIVDAIPIVDVTETLGWSTDVEYVDRWTGVVLVVMRALLIGLLLVPFIVLRHVVAERHQAERKPQPLIESIRAFALLAGGIQQHLDRAEKQLGDTSPHWYAGPFLDANTYFDPRPLEHQLDRIDSLIGPGPAVDAGQRLIDALAERRRAVEDVRWSSSGSSHRNARAQQDLERTRRDVAATRSEYERLAADALQAAAVDAPG
jgi:hypothetical protein